MNPTEAWFVFALYLLNVDVDVDIHHKIFVHSTETLNLNQTENLQNHPGPPPTTPPPLPSGHAYLLVHFDAETSL